MKINGRFSHWLGALIAVVVVSAIAAILQWRITENELLKAQEAGQSAQMVYGADAKEDGEPLTLMPVKITEEYIIYTDRVLERFNYEQKDITKATDAINALYSWAPGDTNVYLMFAPLRIAFEQNTTVNDAEVMKEAAGEIYSSIPNGINIIDVYDTLSSHSDEYIYFRTEETWTALGAYYAAGEFLQSKGIEIHPIEEYKYGTFPNYSGAYKNVEGAEEAMDNDDTIYFYYLKTSANSQLITAYQDGEYPVYESPAIAVSRRSIDIFVGDYYSHSVIEGDKEDGSSVMIFGDNYSKIFSVWLIPYYDKVCVVDTAYFEGTAEDIQNLIDTYNVQDILLIQSARMIQSGIRSSKMSQLFEQALQGEAN